MSINAELSTLYSKTLFDISKKSCGTLLSLSVFQPPDIYIMLLSVIALCPAKYNVSFSNVLESYSMFPSQLI